MSLARLVVTAVRVEGRAKAEVARDYGVSPRWCMSSCVASMPKGRRASSPGPRCLAARSLPGLAPVPEAATD